MPYIYPLLYMEEPQMHLQWKVIFFSKQDLQKHFYQNNLQISPLRTSTFIFFTILKESQDNSLSPTDPHMIFW